MMEKTKVENLAEIFNKHLEEHRQLPESSRQRDLGSEKSLIRDYSGRVVFELFQNALDRAGKDGDPGFILIALLNGTSGGCRLIVGNDGAGVSAYPRSKDLGQKKHSDFHAMLSLHSSTKQAKESIGNKGIGFRSVFASSEIVNIFSRASTNDPWWGFCIKHPAQCKDQGQDWTSNETASFYSPDSLTEEASLLNDVLADRLSLPTELSKHIPSLVTVIELPLLKQGAKEDVQSAITSLSDPSMPLHFLKEKSVVGVRICLYDGLKEGALPCVRAIIEDPCKDGWVFVDAKEIPLDDQMREITGLTLDEAKVCLGLLPENPAAKYGTDTGQVIQETLFWSYLPTEQPAGFGVHIHGDFCLTNSRRGVTFSKGDGKVTSPQTYNYQLLEKAADAIVYDLWKMPNVLARTDFWRIARPSTCKSPELKNLVAERFLKKEVFQEIVKSSFDAEAPIKWPRLRYDSFFDAMGDWVGHIIENGLLQKEFDCQQYKKRQGLMRWIAESGAKVLPVLVGEVDPEVEVEEAVAVPLKNEGTKTESHTVYLKGTGEEGSFFVPTEVCHINGFYVTTFRSNYFNSEQDVGMTVFNRVEILRKIQVGDTIEEHSANLEFVLDLIFQRRGKQSDTSIKDEIVSRYPQKSAWRFTEAEGSRSNLIRAGISLSKLCVPVIANGQTTWMPAEKATWLPASTRQLMKAASDWPWPLLDEDRMMPLLRSIASNYSAEHETIMADVCTVMGISIGPLLEFQGSEGGGVIADFKNLLDRSNELIRHDIALAVISTWELSMHPLIEVHKGLKELLNQTPWIPADLHFDVVRGNLSVPSHSLTIDDHSSLRPIDLWLMPGSDISDLLHGLKVADENATPLWARDLDIVKLGTKGRDKRTIEALYGLKKRYPRPSLQGNIGRKLEETYRRLVRALNDELERTDIPVLIHDHNPHGVLNEIRWMEDGEGCWFDDGKYQWALRAFQEKTRVWSVRKEKVRLAEWLGLKKFEPSVKILPDDKKDHMDLEKSRLCSERISKAVPYLFAAASLVRSGSAEFKEDEALAKWQTLSSSDLPVAIYLQDVWWKVDFDGLSGTIGKGSQGDIIYDKEKNRIFFDSPTPPLIWFAKPLSLALCENEAFVPAFAQVLTAWPARQDGSTDGDEDYIERVKRDIGLGDCEIARWKELVAASTLSQDQVFLWQDTILKCLGKFGNLKKERPQPGSFVVDRNTWSDLHAELTQKAVLDSLKNALEQVDDKVVSALIPDIQIATSNQVFWNEHKNTIASELLALYVAGVGRDITYCSVEEWGKRRDEGQSILNRDLTEPERYKLGKLPFEKQDIKDLLSARLQISSELLATQVPEKVQRFLSGQILLEDKPVDTAIQPLAVTSARITQAMMPKTQAEYAEKQKRNTQAGNRAELCVLELALEHASRWHEEYPDEFWQKLQAMVREMLSPFASDGLDAVLKDSNIAEILDGKLIDRLTEILQVSKWWGNAGFDVLFPEPESKVFHLVEVKSVWNADSPSFFFSINEINKAMDYLRAKLIWRIWCVDDSGRYRIVDGQALALNRNSTGEPEDLSSLLKKIETKGYLPESFRISLGSVAQ